MSDIGQIFQHYRELPESERVMNNERSPTSVLSSPSYMTIAVPSTLPMTSDEPAITGLAFVLAIVVIAVTIAKPIMSIVRDWKVSGVDAAKAASETYLYEQLKKQIESMALDIEKLRSERDNLYSRTIDMENELKRMKLCEESVISMRKRLEEKDAALLERELENRSLTRTILDMKDKIHKLELRLTRDERQFAECKNCERLTVFRGPSINEDAANGT